MKRIITFLIPLLMFTSCVSMNHLKLNYTLIEVACKNFTKDGKVESYDGIIRINKIYYSAKFSPKMKLIYIEENLGNVKNEDKGYNLE